jgi:hypothetical protein
VFLKIFYCYYLYFWFLLLGIDNNHKQVIDFKIDFKIDFLNQGIILRAIAKRSSRYSKDNISTDQE